MKRLLYISILAICISNGKAGQRFFLANSIRCLNALIFNYTQNETGEIFKISPDTIYIEVWTGNDTIVDGRKCVTLWNQYERDMSEYPNRVPVTPNVPLYAGAVYEAENGYVYLYEYEYGEWTILYDFSDSNWEIGDELYVMDNYGPLYEPFFEEITELLSCTLCNGEEVAVANGLMYGIGYNDRSFFSPLRETNLYVPVDIPVEFYRDGVLLYQRFKRGNPHSGIDADSKTYSCDYYDLQGRPVANPTRGIYIKDGRKVVIGQ